MTGIKIPPGGHCKVLCAGAAAGKPLCHTGPSLQINHKMEEIYFSIIFLYFCNPVNKFVIFFIYLFYVLSIDGRKEVNDQMRLCNYFFWTFFFKWRIYIIQKFICNIINYMYPVTVYIQ